MPRLVIEIYGYEYEIVCGQISKRAKDDLVKYCNEHNKSIEDVFYREDEIMKKIYGDDALPVWSRCGGFTNEPGITIDNRSGGIDIFFDDDDPYFDWEKILKKISYTEPKPVPDKGYVSVICGRINSSSIKYESDIEGDFDASKLVLHFHSFKNIGIKEPIINSISYNGIYFDFEYGYDKGEYKEMLNVIFIENG